MIRQLYDYEIPMYVDKLWDFVGDEYIKKRGHYLRGLYNKYFRWAVNRNRTKMPREVLVLAGHAVNLFAFQKDWDKSGVRELVQKKLRNVLQVKELLFEFRAAVNYGLYNESVTWLANIGCNPEPDLRIMTTSGQSVFVECLRLQDKTYRPAKAEILRRDILRGLRNKATQRAQFEHPLMTALYVPEEYHWAYNAVTDHIGDKVGGRFLRSEYAAISALTVVANESPKLRRATTGGSYHDTSLPAVVFRNPLARHPLPGDFNYLAR